MKRYQKAPGELKKLFTLEWRRAVKILSPLLDNQTKPRLYLANLRRYWGWHVGNDRIVELRVNGRWIGTKHLIAISTRHWESQDMYEIKRTLRHEICHVLEQNHGKRFWKLTQLLSE